LASGRRPGFHPNPPQPGQATLGFLPRRQYIYKVWHHHFRRLPQSTDHTGKRTGAVVKRLWVEGQRRGISATEMPGFDSRSAKQNFPQELQEDFRSRLPSLDRRGGLGGELFDFFFSFFVFDNNDVGIQCPGMLALPRFSPYYLSLFSPNVSSLEVGLVASWQHCE